MNLVTYIIAIYAFFILFCFIIPFVFPALLHTDFALDHYSQKGKWYMFKHFYFKDTLKLLGIGLLVMTLLLLFLVGISTSLGKSVAFWTVISVLFGGCIILLVWSRKK